MPTLIEIGEADAAIAAAGRLCDEARWEESHALLRRVLRHEPDPAARLRLTLALIQTCNDEDWSRGVRDRETKRKLIEEAEAQIGDAPRSMAAELLFLQGMALHIEFVMGTGEHGGELACFTDAARLFGEEGDTEGRALAMAFAGIFHHVVRLDRDTAEPLLRQAYQLAAAEGSEARSEAARHLGQIIQERGDPAGALPLLEESLRQRAEAGQCCRLASALHALGFACLEAGDLRAARDYLGRARLLGERYGSDSFLPILALTEADLAFREASSPPMHGRSHP